MDRAENIITVVCEKAMPMLNEYQQRILAGCLADGYGHGGRVLVSIHCTLSRNTIAKGVKEIHSINALHQSGIRKTGNPPLKSLLNCLVTLIRFSRRLLTGIPCGSSHTAR